MIYRTQMAFDGNGPYLINALQLSLTRSKHQEAFRCFSLDNDLELGCGAYSMKKGVL
jgi:hypothetical protein